MKCTSWHAFTNRNCSPQRSSPMYRQALSWCDNHHYSNHPYSCSSSLRLCSDCYGSSLHSTILSGQFVDLVELLTTCILSAEMEGRTLLLYSLGVLQTKELILNFGTWVQCFMFYVAVINQARLLLLFFLLSRTL